MLLKIAVTLGVAFSLCITHAGLFDNLLNGLGSASIDEDVLKKYSSAHIKPGEVNDLTIITDNDQAFQSKIELIKNAKESIDLVYYILSDDHSTSRLNKALIEAATKNKVKIRIVADILQNYQRLDVFNMLIEKGQGNIEVRFFGRPTRNMVVGAVFLTSSCGDKILALGDPGACAKEKFKIVDQVFKGESKKDVNLDISTIDLKKKAPLAAMFLAGLYTKSPALLHASTVKTREMLAMIKANQSEEPVSAEDVAKLKELANLVYKAKTSTGLERVGASMKLLTAFQLYGQELNPIYNKVSGVVALDVENSQAYMKSNDTRAKDWDFATDFTHHKLLLVDGKDFQMGGRNLENSYHMKPNDLSAKYTFMDTDVLVGLKSKNKKMVKSFDKIWNYEAFVASVADLDKIAPYQGVANFDHAKIGCVMSGLKTKETILPCISRIMAKGMDVSMADRIAFQNHLMNQKSQEYEAYYRNQKSAFEPSFTLSENDKKTATLSYLENVPYDKSAKEVKRIYGAGPKDEAASGKYLHEVWIRSLKSICFETKNQKSDDISDVVIHNAYFAPPSNLLSAFAKMVDGTWNCGRVRVSILTNSFQTTDLRIVNSFGMMGMKAFFDYYAEMKQSKSNCKSGKCATFRYMEYQGSAGESAANQKSLHSKVSVFGKKHMMVASANADYRSYMMDTNNGLLIRNAPDLVGSYMKFFNNIVNDPKRVKDLTNFYIMDGFDTVLAQNSQVIDADIRKYGVAKKFKNSAVENLKAKGLSDAEIASMDDQIDQKVESRINGYKLQIEMVLREVHKMSAQSVDSLKSKLSSASSQNEKEQIVREKERAMHNLNMLFKVI